MRRRKKEKAPAVPENIRLIDSLGNSWPCEVVYDGEVDGLHLWTATPMVTPPTLNGVKVRIGLMPPKTTVSVVLGEKDD